MIQYPNGVFSHSQGVISSITDLRIDYELGSDLGSSGSPILTWKFEAIGLHCGSYENTTLKLATQLQLIRDFFCRFVRAFFQFGIKRVEYYFTYNLLIITHTYNLK